MHDQKTEKAQTISRMLLYGQEKPIRRQSSETNNKINTGYPIWKRSVKQLAGFYKTLGWILWTFRGANASAAST